MNYTINIEGQGAVNRELTGNSVALTAIPDVSWAFRYFLNGGEKIFENPFSVEVSEGLQITAVFYVPVEEYLRGLVGFDVTESAFNSIRISRGIEKGCDVAALSVKERELLYADLLMWGASSPTSYTGSRESDGGWMRTEAGKTISVTDKKRFENTAKSIYKKYQDKRYSSGIKLVNLW